MAKNTEAEYWRQKHDRMAVELTKLIIDGNLLFAVAMLAKQRDCGCKTTMEACGENCDCKNLLDQDMNSIRKMRGI